MAKGKPNKDITGQRFGMFEVLEYVDKSKLEV